MSVAELWRLFRETTNEELRLEYLRAIHRQGAVKYGGICYENLHELNLNFELCLKV